MSLTWNQGSADDDIDFFTLLSKKVHFGLDELLRHLFGVTSDALSRLFDLYFQWLGPKRLELLQSCWPDSRKKKSTITVG